MAVQPAVVPVELPPASIVASGVVVLAATLKFGGDQLGILDQDQAPGTRSLTAGVAVVNVVRAASRRAFASLITSGLEVAHLADGLRVPVRCSRSNDVHASRL